MIHNEYTSMLEDRRCKGGCGVKFRCLPTSQQWYARSNCAIYCKDRLALAEAQPEPPAPPPIPKPITEPPKAALVEKPRDVPSRKVESMQANIEVETKPAKNRQPPKAEQKPVPKNEPVVLEVAESQVEVKIPEPKAEPRKKLIDSDIVSRMDARFQQLYLGCIEDARKLSGKRHELKTKMAVAYLCVKSMQLSGSEDRETGIKNFATLIELDPVELNSWIRVRQLIWERLGSTNWIEKYAFDDLLAVANQIKEPMKQVDIERFIEEKISGKYLTLVKHFQESLTNINHFYENFSLELLSDEQFDENYELLKKLSIKFQGHAHKRRGKAYRQTKKVRS